MIQSAFTYSRTLLRAFVTGVTAENQRFSNQHLQQQASKQRLHLISAVAGFSKSINPTVHQTKWSYGEDAYFIANHRATYVLGGFLLGYHCNCSHMLITTIHFVIEQHKTSSQVYSKAWDFSNV